MKQFILLGFLSQIFYLMFYLIKPLAARFGINSFYLSDDRLFYITLLILVSLTILYIFSASTVSQKKVKLKHILFFAVFFNLSLLFIWTVGSDDLFSYIYRSRLISEYGVNPYVVPYDAFSTDKFYPFLKTIWSGTTAVYGPMFMVLGGALSYLGGNSLLANIAIFKFVFVLANIINCILVYKITKSKLALILYSWNPIVLFELALNAHLEVLMIFFFLSGIYFITKIQRRFTYLVSWVLVIFSVLIKFFTVLTLPFIYVYFLRKKRSVVAKFSTTLALAFVTALVVILFYIPFWEGSDILLRLRQVAAAESTNMSPGIYFTNIFLPFSTAKTVSRIVFVFICVYFFVRYTRNGNQEAGYIFKYLLISIGAFFTFFLTLFLPWYLTLFVATGCLYIGFSKKESGLLVYIPTVYAILMYFSVR